MLLLLLLLVLLLFLLVLLLLLLVLRLLVLLWPLLVLLLLLLLLCWWGLWLLRILRRLAGLATGVKVAAAKAHVHLGGQSIWHRLIFGSLLLRFCLGRTPRRCPLRRRRRARGRTVAAGWRWR